jgi:hypothetical protein
MGYIGRKMILLLKLSNPGEKSGIVNGQSHEIEMLRYLNKSACDTEVDTSTKFPLIPKIFFEKKNSL